MSYLYTRRVGRQCPFFFILLIHYFIPFTIHVWYTYFLPYFLGKSLRYIPVWNCASFIAKKVKEPTTGTLTSKRNVACNKKKGKKKRGKREQRIIYCVCVWFTVKEWHGFLWICRGVMMTSQKCFEVNVKQTVRKKALELKSGLKKWILRPTPDLDPGFSSSWIWDYPDKSGLDPETCWKGRHGFKNLLTPF